MDDVYYEAAYILSEVESKRNSFRNLIFESRCHNKKLLYKLCFETMKRRSGFEQILSRIPNIADHSNYIDCYCPFIQYILFYEHLFGHGLKKCCREWRAPIENHSATLSQFKNEIFADKSHIDREFTVKDSEFQEHIYDGILECKNLKKFPCVAPERYWQQQNNSFSDASNLFVMLSKSMDSIMQKLPRYVRINTLKVTIEEAKQKLINEGWRLIETDKSTRKRFRDVVERLTAYDFCFDTHIPELLIFPSGTDLHLEDWVINGNFVLQDKSSCLPTICLECRPGSHVMDMCAAPGIKTSHVAALIKNEGKIFAYDKNFDRFRLMEGMLETKGVTCVEMYCQDMLRLNFNDKIFKKVTHVILDPPCSGSGMVKRLDFLTDNNERKDSTRLQKLANLQTMMLKHALNLPNLRRLVYSTCSIHEEENEQVVAETLEHCDPNFKLVEALPSWKHRGRRNYEFGKMCLRASPEKDRTNGFFVAVFERNN
uniref:SAM-dependent MTase RsmB/NOP-type domain-containing protein n=1 Tax=Romanomermis culicivorax TaxID=13658 RepID=A0A915J515_ROMCU